MLEGARIVLGNEEPLKQVPRQIEIGIGDLPGLRDGVLSLNHKRPDASLRSATEFVATAGLEEMATWREALIDPEGAAPFDGLTIALEDASPDSCLALLCLHLRLCSAEMDPAWVDYASRWELGYGDTTGQPEQSFGVLLSALTHALFKDAAGDADAVAKSRDSLFRQAMAYTQGLVGLDLDPANLPRVFPLGSPSSLQDLHGHAHVRLARERGLYERILAGALKTQLSIPVAGTDRRMDVDALLMTEIDYSGTIKILLRSDSRSPLGRGYTLWGLYRPALKGTGADMTVSVDPASSLTLKELWIELERREEAAWKVFACERGGADGRPRHPAREGMISYKEKPPIAIPSQQPWWEGRPLFSMVGAPRSVQIEGETFPGSRLDWTDVKQALWALYAPVQDLNLRRYDYPNEAPWRAFDAGATQARTVLGSAESGLFGVRLSLVPAADGVPVRWSDAIAASLAALVDSGRIDMDRLPSADSFDVIEARGGIALITARGMLLIDVNTAPDFPMEDLARAAREVAVTVACSHGIVDTINDQLRDLVETAIDAGLTSDKRKVLKAIYATKLRARQTWAGAARFEQDPLVRQFRTLCEARWNAKERLDTALAEVAELETMVVSSSEIRANTTLNAIAFIGFPLSVFGNLLGSFILMDGTTQSVAGLSWEVMAYYVGFSGVALVIVWLLARLYDRTWRQKRKSSAD